MLTRGFVTYPLLKTQCPGEIAGALREVQMRTKRNLSGHSPQSTRMKVASDIHESEV